VELWQQLLLVALVVAVLWFILQPRYTFLVRIDPNGARIARGKVSTTFVQQVQQACADVGVVHGWVGGVRGRQRVSLAFSRSIPAGCRQRIRNAWVTHG
jgi:hypothetical protein